MVAYPAHGQKLVGSIPTSVKMIKLLYFSKYLKLCI